MPAGIPESYRRLPASGISAGPPPPDPTLGEGLGASARNAFDHVWSVQDRRVDDAYSELVDGLLRRRGMNRTDNPLEQLPYHDNSWRAWVGLNRSQWDKAKVWAEVAAARETDPTAFPGLAQTQEDFERQVLTRGGAQQRDAAIAARSPWYVQLGGGLVGSLADPINVAGGIALGGVSKGAGLLRGTLIEGAANAGLEVAELPLTIEANKRLGETTTAGDVALNVGAAFVLGGAFHAAPAGVKATWQTGRAGFEKAVAANWERLPQALRDRWSAAASLPEPDDLLLADMADALIPPGKRSEAEQTAIDVLRREGEIAAASPFAANGAGQAFHAQALGADVDRIIGQFAGSVPAAPRAPVMPARARLASGTAVQSQVVTGDALDGFMRRVRGAESSGNDAAAAGTSSAYGRYQFTKGTWLAYYKRRYGSQGLSDAQIVAKRGNGALQDVLMRDLTESNAAFLRARGEPVTAGNLYLVHFAGEGGARRLFDADPSARVEGVLTADAIKANGFLRGKTVGDVLAWADRKMGGAGVAQRGGGLAPAEGLDADAALRAEIDRINAESASIEAALATDRPRVDDAPEAMPDLVPVETIDTVGEALPAAAPLDPRGMDYDAPPPEVLALLPKLQAVIDDRGRSLNKLDAVAADLGAEVADVRRGLTLLAAEGRLAMNRKTGAFMRKPPRPDGPLDVFEAIAKAGGIRDDEGHALGLVRQEGRFAGQKGGRNLQTMTRHYGPLLRRSGMPLDRLGEFLYEGQFLFGADGGRPTTAEVLAFLDQRKLDGKPRYSMADQAMMAPVVIDGDRIDGLGLDAGNPVIAAHAATIEAELRRLHGAEAHFPAEVLDEAARVMRDMEELGFPVRGKEAWDAGLRRLTEDSRLNAFDETGDASYLDGYHDDPTEPDLWTTEWYDWLDRQHRGDRAAGTDRGGPAGVAGNARASGAAGGRLEAGPALADLPPEETTRFLDPDGPDAKIQLDSLDHDARAVLDRGEATDPAIAARQAQEAQLRAEAPLRGENATGQAQDGTMGLGLFDAADQPGLRLDADGEDVALGDLLDQFDAEAAEIKNAKDCL